MDNRNQLEQLNTAPQPFKTFLQEQGQKQLESLKSVRQPNQVSVAPLFDQGTVQSAQSATPKPAQNQATNPEMQALERQQSFLSTKGKITQQFGNRNPIEQFSGGVNYGTDIAVPEGTKIAVPDGQWEVVESYGDASGAGFIGNNTNRGYGNSVLVRNQQTGEMLRFSHLSDAMVRAGQVLDGGTVIGLSGSTGNATGPHLDLEYYDQSGRLQDVLASRYGGGLIG